MFRMEKVIYIIPTPIGNLEDITLRSIRILKESNLVLAEDTRITRRLFRHYGIKTHMQSHHSFNEHKNNLSIIEKINSGLIVSLVSDAGTPAISDPGYLLIRECIRNNIAVHCLPGPTAFVPALVQSGVPCDKFIFEGFLPPKKGRNKKILELISYGKTTIIYESPHKILKILSDFKSLCPDRQLVVVKELTKIHETTYRGTAAQIYELIESSKIKGEYTIILHAKQ